MANGNFVVQNGLQVGPLTIDAATGGITTTGPITSTSGITVVTQELVLGTEVVAGNLVANSGTTSSSTTTGALVVTGGVGVSGALNIGGNVTFSGQQASHDNGTITMYDSILDLHTYGNLATWASDDGKDIGLRMHYYKGSDNLAFLGWENTTQTLQYLQSATETNSNVSGTFGNVQFGSLTLSNATASTNTTSGALIVSGGAGIAGAAYIGGNANVGGTLVLNTITSAFGTGGNVIIDPDGAGDVVLPANTELFVQSTASSTNAATGAIVVSGGAGITGAIYGGSTIIASGNIVAGSGTVSSSASTGALVVAGAGGLGVGGSATIGGNLTVAGNLTVQGINTIISSQDLTLTDSVINLHTFANLAPLSSDDGRDVGMKFHYYKAFSGGDNLAFLGWQNSTGFLEYYAAGSEGVGNVFTGGTQGTIKAGEFISANATASSSTTTGAIVTSGGIGIAGKMYIGDDINITGGKNILPTTSNTAVIGSSSLWFSGVYAQNFYGTSTTAKYADLAENYQADSNYPYGTVVMFGGAAEVTVAAADTTRVAGVVSQHPAHLMNGGLSGANVVPLALTGRVPCNVIGPVAKGDLMVSAGFGFAKSNNNAGVGQVIGKALADFPSTTKGQIEVVVGRF